MRYEIRLMFKRITNPQYTIRSDLIRPNGIRPNGKCMDMQLGYALKHAMREVPDFL